MKPLSEKILQTPHLRQNFISFSLHEHCIGNERGWGWGTTRRSGYSRGSERKEHSFPHSANSRDGSDRSGKHIFWSCLASLCTAERVYPWQRQVQRCQLLCSDNSLRIGWEFDEEFCCCALLILCLKAVNEGPRTALNKCESTLWWKVRKLWESESKSSGWLYTTNHCELQ